MSRPHVVLTLHSHLPWVLHHGRWPHGSDWLCEAAVDTYLPLTEALLGLAIESVDAPVTLSVTPILANQLTHPDFVTELEAFFAQRIAAAAEPSDDPAMELVRDFWRQRYVRLRRLFHELDSDIIGAWRRLADAGRLELMSSAATHGFLPLLAWDESIRFQLALGAGEHRRIFGRDPAGCWVPECAYRARGPWAPHPLAPASAMRPGIEEHLAATGFRYFFVDAHQVAAGRSLSASGAWDPAGVPPNAEGHPPVRSPYRTWQAGATRAARRVTAFVRDPRSSMQVWNRHMGYPGDGAYLEFHKIRMPDGLKLWRVTSADTDLGEKLPYDRNVGRARAHIHARHFAGLLADIADGPEAGPVDVIAIPFDTELFGHWWFEGPDFLRDLYRALAEQSTPLPATASTHLAAVPPRHRLQIAEGSWGEAGDFRKWLNPETLWTWERIWEMERRFWTVARRHAADPLAEPLLSQAAREVLLAQSSDWQFIISTGAAGDYAEARFRDHATMAETLIGFLERPSDAWPTAAVALADSQGKNDCFPDVMTALRIALAGPTAS